ncbi:MAG: hypothetical protein HFI19_08685 [Lachnospiraceae bacterium]|uniref:MscL family protein n=1 Tax=Candidatus Merdisoma sp. JLR.KK006 TaxID=3112626 RepID=UPI002FF0F9A9|nr:hypothetical protein [Lachnospiraceae bacterium]
MINFLLTAFVVFIVVKQMNKLHRKKDEPAAPAAPTTKICPHCMSKIHIQADKCPYCTSDVE